MHLVVEDDTVDNIPVIVSGRQHVTVDGMGMCIVDDVVLCSLEDLLTRIISMISFDEFVNTGQGYQSDWLEDLKAAMLKEEQLAALVNEL